MSRRLRGENLGVDGRRGSTDANPIIKTRDVVPRPTPTSNQQVVRMASFGWRPNTRFANKMCRMIGFCDSTIYLFNGNTFIDKREPFLSRLGKMQHFHISRTLYLSVEICLGEVVNNDFIEIVRTSIISS